MPADSTAQTQWLIGIDVGGTFTDLIASDGQKLRIIKVPSTPPDFEKGVVSALSQLAMGNRQWAMIHGSTVATNALLQRAGAPSAFVTTEGFADMLLIGRQNRPRLYALDIHRPAPITTHTFGVRERIDAQGNVLTPLDESHAHEIIRDILSRDIRHVAICLLFSFINPAHEKRLGALCEQSGLTVSLSSDILPEFREYERASTTAINATLRPPVEKYLSSLSSSLNPEPRTLNPSLSIMHSSGGTLSPAAASAHAARLVLSGPAGGILGAAYVARLAGFADCITYDMGGTSTDVAAILNGAPQWTTQTTIDGLPIALPMFDIHTIGAGGGSVAYLDEGGALRVGPRSAGANPGPACYARGGTEPTVTDANVVLGRIRPDAFLGGAMRIDPALAERAIAPLAAAMNKSITDTALGIVRVVESNMEAALRAVTSRRGHDPRNFTLVSFGGAGGLHACAIAASLGIARVLIPPCAGVLSALGMVVAPPVADASKTVIHLRDELDDARLAAEFGFVNAQTITTIPHDQTAAVEAWADVRFKGQSHELKIRVTRPAIDIIRAGFLAAYTQTYGRAPQGDRPIKIVTLRIRRLGHAPKLELPRLSPAPGIPGDGRVILADGANASVPILTRAELFNLGSLIGPALLIDAEATAFIPPHWRATANEDGGVVLRKEA